MNIDRRHFAALALATCFIGVDAVAQPAPSAKPAPQPVSAEVMVLHATQQPKGSIDPQIGNLPQLTKPPFSAYNTYKLIGKTTLPLEKNKPQTYTLVNQRVLQVSLQDIVTDNAKPPVTRYKVATAINQPSGKDFLKLLEVTASPNETFFVAGQSHAGGILVIGITIKPS